jgi:hypothetical protein
MAGTRNKQTYSDYCIFTKGQETQSFMQLDNNAPPPSYPCGVNVQYVPSNRLSSNAIDLETNLFGIGSNNYIFPTSTPTPSFTSLSTVVFTPLPNLYIPRLPPYLQFQRP